MSCDTVISVRGVTKRYRIFNHPLDRLKQVALLGAKRFYRHFTALDNVSFEVRKGETVGIIGRNGSGKSTLLQVICGILKPTSGEVIVQGRVSALLELGAGFHPELTGRENVYFLGTILGLGKKEIDQRFPAISAFADIGEFIDQPVRTYSSGMHVRLAFAASIHVDPDILVIDEALAVGDAAFQSKCYAKLQELKKTGATIILVSHDLNVIVTYCDRALVLDRGAIVENGSAKAGTDAYRRLLATRQGADSLTVETAPSWNKNRTPGPLTEWAGLFQVNAGETRYGSKKSEILEAGIFTLDQEPTQVLRQHQECLIKIKVHSSCSMPAPMIFCAVKDLKGVVLFVINTLVPGVDMGWMEAGETLIVTFRQRIPLNPGSYVLSVGSQELKSDGEVLAHDHRIDYMAFEIVGPLRPGIFDAQPTVEWCRCS